MTTTTKSKGLAFAGITLVIVILTLVVALQNNTSQLRYSYQVVKENNGWGYEIKDNNKVIIHQTNIPAIQGHKPFTTKNDAEKVAELVTYKLNNNITPAISVKELQELDISLE